MKKIMHQDNHYLPEKFRRVIIFFIFILTLMIHNFLFLSRSGLCQASKTDVKDIILKVEKSIDVRQATQKMQETWEVRKDSLTALYDQLIMENEQLAGENQSLLEEIAQGKRLIQELEGKKQRSLSIQQNMMPFLESMHNRLIELVAMDSPFLSTERRKQIAELSLIMDDNGVSIAEKYNKIMNLLFIEAEYGSSSEVYQEKIQLGTRYVLGNVFRLGRISLFFLTLDKNEAAFFNVAENRWELLDEKFIPKISTAVDIIINQRPADLIDLPLGCLSSKGNKNE